MTAITTLSPPQRSLIAPRPKRWQLLPPAPPAQAAALALRLGVPPLLAAILSARGLDWSLMDAPLVLHPNPALFQAAKQIKAAIEGNKRIRIHGDYDADGVSASAVLVLGLSELGADVHAFIPHRINDGYGILARRVPEHIEACDLFITVDCGVSNIAEVKQILEAGVQVIITDHHAPGEVLPNCLVVHPALKPGYIEGEPSLTGAGVAFHLLWAVRKEFGLSEPPNDYSDLATIGMIADVIVPLGENRALLRLGLAQLPKTRWPGLRAAMEARKMHKSGDLELESPKSMRSQDVGFVIAPLINAAGRMGEAETALELLLTQDPKRAMVLAKRCIILSGERRKIQRHMTEEALAIADGDAPAIVISKSGWHPGVMGIVASKVLETHYKPVYIIAEGKGSVRSVPGISAVGGLRFAADLLKRFGGHPGAAGFAIEHERFGAFRQRIEDYAQQFPTPVQTLMADAILTPDQASLDLLDFLHGLEPFGQEFLEPRFLFSGVLSEPRTMGKEKEHWSFLLSGGEQPLKVKQWHQNNPFERGDELDILASVELNHFQGKASIELTASALRYRHSLSLLGADTAPSIGPASYPRLDPQPALRQLRADGGLVYANGASLEFLQQNPGLISFDVSLASASNPLTLFAMPEHQQLTQWLASAIPLRFALTERTLAQLENGPYWTLERLRALRTRDLATLPAIAQSLLSDLDWRDPYRNNQALVAHETLAYQWQQFVRLYRRADEASFALALRRLFSDSGPD
jgi:single-stranded-DNA-specific exonuclease